MFATPYPKVCLFGELAVRGKLLASLCFSVMLHTPGRLLREISYLEFLSDFSTANVA
jgi:hypothetical protein